MEQAFSTATFRSLLRAGLEGGFRFVTVDETEAVGPDERVCVLRHDVDSDPGAALELAVIEAEEGVRATFFVMVRSPVYNLFARETQELVEGIAAKGHAIGLHYDPGFPPRGGRTHTEQIAVELDVLSRLLGLEVRSVALHQPSLVLGAFEIPVEGAANANALDYHFLADPNQSPRVFEAFDVFAAGEPRRLQLLVHPMWWVGDEGKTPAELWDRAVRAQWERAQRQLLVERAYGPPRTLVLEPERPTTVT